jgi:hypothetical protein
LIILDLSPDLSPPQAQQHHDEVIAEFDRRYLKALQRLTPAEVERQAQDLDERIRQDRQRLHQEHAALQATTTVYEDEFFPYLINRLLQHCPNWKTNMYQLVQEVGWESLFVLSALHRRQLRMIHKTYDHRLPPSVVPGLTRQFTHHLARSDLYRTASQLWRNEHDAGLIRTYLQHLDDQGLLASSPHRLRESA